MNIRDYLQLNTPLYTRKGKFTTAYIYGNKVILDSCDPLKECMSFGWFPKSKHVPVVTRSHMDSAKVDHTVYTMPRYTQGSPKSILCTKDYEDIYKPLRELYHSSYLSFNPHNWHGEHITAFSKLRVSERLKDILIESYEACLNYSNKVRFEISPRNIAAGKSDRLILLDCFYIC